MTGNGRRNGGWKRLAAAVAAALAAVAATGCARGGGEGSPLGGARVLSEADAKAELKELAKAAGARVTSDPALDIYMDEANAADALASVDTFPIAVRGTGEVDVEIAAATEMSSAAPDDWMVEAAKKFNASSPKVGGKSASVSIRKITSGEAVTYVADGGYRPQAFAPSVHAWGDMLEAEGFGLEKIADRLAGNTAGVLIKKDVYEKFAEKYGEADVKSVLEASLAGDLTFAYTNPYTSSTGLNVLTAMLAAFDPDDPLSETASAKLLEYQKQSPPVAYTTAVLRNQAAKGVIDAMVMEEQAYVNTPELKGYVYVPVGMRHDHPFYAFDYDTEEEKEVARAFAEWCQGEEAQEMATERGFNRHDDYEGVEPGLDGAGFLAAQRLWKENKDGGRPIMAVFVADVSGSMDGEPLNSLKRSLVGATAYIGSKHYVGLVSFSSKPTVNLPIAPFDAKQRAYFSGEVKGLSAGGGTATYDALAVALDMIEKGLEETPDAKPMAFLLSDGDQNLGVGFERIAPVVGGLRVPVYSIAYNYQDDDLEELENLSGINEAACVKADSEDVANHLRNLFNVQM